MRRNGGFILLYVVAMVAALTLMLFQLNQMKGAVPAQVDRQVSRAIETWEARLLLDFVTSGLVDRTTAVDPRYLAYRRLLLDDPSRLSEMEDALAQLKAMLDRLGFDISLGRGKGKGGGAIQHDGKGILFAARTQSYAVVLGEREYKIRILPGNGLPNVNALPYDPMWRYLKHLGVAEKEARDMAAALIDWRDADNFLTDVRGAEQEHYALQKAPYSPRNAPFGNWQELAYIRGIGPDRLQLIREHFTLGRPDAPRVFVDYVSPEILAELCGLPLDIVRSILKEYGRLQDPANHTSAREIADVLMTQDAAAFDALVAWQPDATQMRIDISGPGSRLTADYDMVRKRLLAWW